MFVWFGIHSGKLFIYHLIYTPMARYNPLLATLRNFTSLMVIIWGDLKFERLDVGGPY